MTRIILDAVAADLARTALAHLVLIVPVILLVACFLVRGLAAALLDLARSKVGRIVMACAMALIVGWEARAACDASTDRTERLRNDLVAATARIATEIARADESARLAMAQHDIATAIASRERDAELATQSLQRQVQDYASIRNRAPQAGRCVLSVDDARRLRGIDVPAASGRP